MPGWPVNVSCAMFEGVADPTETSLFDYIKSFFGFKPKVKAGADEKYIKVWEAMYDASSVYFNYNNRNATFCTDISDTEGTGNLDGAGWNVLACN